MKTWKIAANESSSGRDWARRQNGGNLNQWSWFDEGKNPNKSKKADEKGREVRKISEGIVPERNGAQQRAVVKLEPTETQILIIIYKKNNCSVKFLR